MMSRVHGFVHSVVLFFLVIISVDALQCWVCGDDASAHDTNPRARMNLRSSGPVKSSWCSANIAAAKCQSSSSRQILCYKEIWHVDGRTMIKRGCAQRDPRYNRTGCEEQITGPSVFNVVLCLCDGNLCNSTFNSRTPLIDLLFFPTMILQLIMHFQT